MDVLSNIAFPNTAKSLFRQKLGQCVPENRPKTNKPSTFLWHLFAKCLKNPFYQFPSYTNILAARKKKISSILKHLQGTYKVYLWNVVCIFLLGHKLLSWVVSGTGCLLGFGDELTDSTDGCSRRRDIDILKYDFCCWRNKLFPLCEMMDLFLSICFKQRN